MSDVSVARPLPPADEVIADVLDLAVAAPLALRSFLGISAIEWSTGITTACVECACRPRLLLNPDFVREHCFTRERLAFLVLHEVCHVSLGHTRLYPCLTPVHNVAFDAVINALVLDWLNLGGIDPAPYAALTCGFYDAAETPLFILRPPPGWPGAPDWGASAGCPEDLRGIHQRLYSLDARVRAGVTYGEILHALTGEGGDLRGRLLGAHGLTGEERAAASSGRGDVLEELAPELMRRLSGSSTDGGWGLAAAPSRIEIEKHRAERRLQQALTRLLRRVFTDQRMGGARRTLVSRPVLSVDPSQDRRAPARRLLARHYAAPQPLLFDAQLLEARADRVAATLYLDVSGSMHRVLPLLHASLVPVRRMIAAEVLAFSCGVAPVSIAAFAQGRVSTAWGTEIESVLRHAAAAAAQRGGARRALVLTDGWFDRPSPAAVRLLAASGAALHVAVMGDGPLPTGDWVTSATRLSHLTPNRG